MSTSLGLVEGSAVELRSEVGAMTGHLKVVRLPIIRTAAEEIGKAFVANIVAIGTIAAITGQVSFDAVEKAVLSRVPKGTEELNKKALMAGYELAKRRAN